jgi:hypothetical protein
VQQLIQSLVIGTAKVIEYKDLVKAYTNYTAKDKAATNKGKRKRSYKRKISV